MLHDLRTSQTTSFRREQSQTREPGRGESGPRLLLTDGITYGKKSDLDRAGTGQQQAGGVQAAQAKHHITDLQDQFAACQLNDQNH